MKLQFLAFGRLKAPGLRDAANYYSKLISTWVDFREIELKPLEVPDKSAATRLLIQEREETLVEEKLAKILSPRGRLYLLDERGKSLTTSHWADTVRSWESGSHPEIVFLIGSSLGFTDSLRRRANGLFSLGPQTLPHELARVVVYEQLYRAWSVVRGHPYHNEGA